MYKLSKNSAQVNKFQYLESGLDNGSIIEEYLPNNDLVYFDTTNGTYLDENGEEIIRNEDEEYDDRLNEGFSTIFQE